MSQSQSLGAALPCAACKQPVIEKRSADGALVVLDAATKRLHLCVKRKAEATKAKPLAAPRPPAPNRPAPPRPAPRPAPQRPTKPQRPAKRVELAKPPADARVHAKVARPPRPPRKEPRPRKPRKTTLRSPQQVEEILKGRILRWRTTADTPTSFCAECSAPVLVGFSHVRWDVMMLDAAGHRPHDCETSRQATAALHRERPVDIPELPRVETARRVMSPTLPPIAPARPVEVAPRPRRRPAGHAPRVEAANSCDTCGKLKSLVNGEWVCLHC